jgi:hypothetical protein
MAKESKKSGIDPGEVSNVSLDLFVASFKISSKERD